jgi:hypothetical protein
LVRVQSIGLCLLLAACDPQGGGADKNGATPADPNIPRMGLYEITTTYEAFPAGEEPESKSEAIRQCLRVNPDDPKSFLDLSNEQCQTVNASFRNGEVRAETVCIWPDRGGEVHFESHGSYSSDRIDVSSDGTIDDGMPVRMTETYVRQEDCPEVVKTL